MSSTLRATTSQPRSLLSIARLNMAKSRVRSPTWSLVRIAQTCLGRKAVALLQSTCPCSKLYACMRLGLSFHDFPWSYSSVNEDDHHAPLVRTLEFMSGFLED